MFSYQHVGLYAFFFGISGVFQGAVWVCTVSIMGNWFDVHMRGKIMGFWIINTSLGNILGAQLGSGLIDLQVSWQIVCIIFLYFYATSYFFSLAVCQESPEKLEKVGKKHVSLIGALKKPGVIHYSILMGCSKLMHYSFLMWLPLFVLIKLDLEEFQGGVLASLYDIGGVIGAISIGWISDRLSNRIYIFFPLLIGTVPLLFTFTLGSKSILWLFYVIIPLVGIAFGGITNLISSAVAADLGENQSDDLDAKTTVVGIIDGSGGIGAGLGQIFIGLLQEKSWNSVFYFILAVNLLAVFTMIPLVIAAVNDKNLQAKKSLELEINKM